MKHIRHGDINFSKVGKAVGETVSHDGTFIVGYGEATGHRHVLKVKDKENLIIKKDTKGNYYFTLLEKGLLSHEEHKTITLPPGTYRKIQEREIDWFAHGVERKVID